MLITASIALLAVIVLLYQKRSILIATASFFTILVLYLLLNYRILPRVLLEFDYTQLFFLGGWLLVINIFTTLVNRLMASEIGYNVRNLFLTIFPVNETRYLILFFIALLPFGNNLVFTLLILYTLARFLSLNKAFSLVPIILGIGLNNLFVKISVTTLGLKSSIFLLIVLTLVAVGFILWFISTNYEQKEDIKVIYYNNTKTLLYTMLTWSGFILSLANEFSITKVLLFSCTAAILILTIMGRTNTLSEKNNIADIPSKYSYLISLCLCLLPIGVILIPTYIYPVTNILIYLIEALVLGIIYLFLFRVLDVKEVEEMSGKIGITGNVYLSAGIIMMGTLYVLLTMSAFNQTNLGTPITTEIVSEINGQTNYLNNLMTIMGSIPFIVNPEMITQMSISENSLNLMILIQPLITIINPLFMLIISGFTRIKPNRVVEVYTFSLIFNLLIVLLVWFVSIV